jgi:hypothetical protein
MLYATTKMFAVLSAILFDAKLAQLIRSEVGVALKLIKSIFASLEMGASVICVVVVGVAVVVVGVAVVVVGVAVVVVGVAVVVVGVAVVVVGVAVVVVGVAVVVVVAAGIDVSEVPPHEAAIKEISSGRIILIIYAYLLSIFGLGQHI